MKLPFHAVEVRGDILFAARGASIHSFNLADGAHIACSWKYPAAEASKNAAHPRKEENHLVINVSENSTPAPSQDEQGPPAKRVKLDGGGDAAAVVAGEEGQVKDETAALRGGGDGDGSGGGKKKKNKNNKKQASRPGPLSQPTERPMVILMVATQDGRYFVVVTSDKSIWVLEHHGQGQLKQLSRRTMPKRPCSVVISPDNQDILSADKFGDVYSLPLIQSPDWKPNASSSATAAAAAPSPATEETAVTTTIATTTTTDDQDQPFKPQATELTVHTKRNRQALVDQQISRTNPKAQRGTPRRVEAEPFERYLLLGHVSLLTAVALGFDYDDDDDDEENNHNHSHNHPANDTDTTTTTMTKKNTPRKRRPYILTADRDEHIRVSRGTRDQVHVIEHFCLGHDEFVNRLCIPSFGHPSSPSPSSPSFDGDGSLLVSAGGDPDLFVWRWRRGQLLCKTPLLDVVRKTTEEEVASNKVAVTGLCEWAFSSSSSSSSSTITTTTAGEGGGESTRIVVICERVPALLIYLLHHPTGALAFARAIPLAGNPMDVAVVNSDALVVAVDRSLNNNHLDKDKEEGGGVGSGVENNNVQNSLVKIERIVGDGGEEEYKVVAGGFSVKTKAAAEELGGDDDEADVSEAEIQKLLYSAETLRKMDFEDGGDAE